LPNSLLLNFIAAPDMLRDSLTKGHYAKITFSTVSVVADTRPLRESRVHRDE
jgi:hypothetical protein